MNGSFRDDVAIQGSVIRRIAAGSSGAFELRDRIRDGGALLGGAQRPIALVGMGSSLHAARTALHRFAQLGRLAVAYDAGELLHFGLPGLPSEASVIAISQSGKSVETVEVAERLCDADRGRALLAIVNDLDSPLARLATVAAPMGAGVESAVATRTFIAASVLLQLLVDELAGVSSAHDDLVGLAAALDDLSADDSAANAVVDGFADLRSLELVGRGASLGVAHYGALTIKETAAFPAEALSGGAFRHGPLELVDAPAGAIVLVPSGPTAELSMRLAREISAAGWETWVIGAEVVVRQLRTDRRGSGSDARLVVTGVPKLDGPLAALPSSSHSSNSPLSSRNDAAASQANFSAERRSPKHSSREVPMPELFQTIYGRGLVPELKTFVHRPYLVVTMDDLWARFADDFDDGLVGPLLVTTLDREELDKIVEGLPACQSVIGLGGGQALDVAKYVAWRRRVPLFQVPTALSVNAAWGERAAVRVDGVVRYVAFAVPEAVYVDYDVIRSAPVELNRSGVGDTLCYWTGHWDWRMAADTGHVEPRWPYDDRLVAEARVALDRVIDNAAEISAVSDTGIRALAESLRWGGAAFHNAGWNPRHIEGAEHFVFYNLEYLTGKHFLHGQPVTLGVLLMSDLQGNRPNEIKAIADRIGVQYRPEQMDVSWDVVAEALRTLPQYVEKAGLWYTVASERPITEDWIARMRDWLGG